MAGGIVKSVFSITVKQPERLAQLKMLECHGLKPVKPKIFHFLEI